MCLLYHGPFVFVVFSALTFLSNCRRWDRNISISDSDIELKVCVLVADMGVYKVTKPYFDNHSRYSIILIYFFFSRLFAMTREATMLK